MKHDYLVVRQNRSGIGQAQAVRLVLSGLGLGRVGRSVVVANTPSFRGAVRKVLHLVTVEESTSPKFKGASR